MTRPLPSWRCWPARRRPRRSGQSCLEPLITQINPASERVIGPELHHPGGVARANARVDRRLAARLEGLLAVDVTTRLSTLERLRRFGHGQRDDLGCRGAVLAGCGKSAEGARVLLADGKDCGDAWQAGPAVGDVVVVESGGSDPAGSSDPADPSGGRCRVGRSRRRVRSDVRGWGPSGNVNRDWLQCAHLFGPTWVVGDRRWKTGRCVAGRAPRLAVPGVRVRGFGNVKQVWPHLGGAGSGDHRIAACSRRVANRAAGEAQSRTLRGRWLSSSATSARSAAVWMDRSVPLGK
jgi:hypothetical protein